MVRAGAGAEAVVVVPVGAVVGGGVMGGRTEAANVPPEEPKTRQTNHAQLRRVETEFMDMNPLFFFAPNGRNIPLLY